MNSHYEAWNTAIVDRFFGPEHAQRPVYLALDDDELGELASAAGTDTEFAAEDLAGAIVPELRRGDTIFVPFLAARERWRRTGHTGPPPYVALLALCVLAASRMARDSTTGIAANAYYPHLNQLLGRPIHLGMPPGFEQLYSLWEDLITWLEEDERGARGRSTIQSHPHFTRIGWALSQCLLRESDRRRLTSFFRSVGLDPGTDVEAGQLWTLLRNWAHPACGLSDRALGLIRRATREIGEQIAEIVKREFVAWDGEIRDSQGRRRGEIALVVEKSAGGRRIRMRLVPRRPDGFPEGDFDLPRGGSIELSAMSDGWYRPLAGAVDRRILDFGLTLTTGGFSLAYEASPVVPFRASLELGAWVSARQATAFEEHCVVSHASAIEPLETFLRSHARPGWRVLDHAETLPAGWVLVERVQITSAAPAVGDELRRLAPRLNAATQLDGGLQIAPRQYLTGGEPDLWVTVGEDQEAAVEIDGRTEMLPGGVAEFPLSRSSPPLASGDHEIVAGGVTRRFASFDGFDTMSTEGTGSLGHALERHRTYRPAAANAAPLGAPPARGTAQVSGAAARGHPEDLPAPAVPPVLLPVGFSDYTLIGAVPGEVLSVLAPEPPGWLVDVGLGGRWQFFDQPIPFDAQWVILAGGRGPQVRPIRVAVRDPDPCPDGLTDAVRAWADAVSATAVTAAPRDRAFAAAWRAYAARAAEAGGLL